MLNGLGFELPLMTSFPETLNGSRMEVFFIARKVKLCESPSKAGGLPILIIRQGNIFYERNPDTFKVKIFNYATKMTYDSRMWQCIEYKSAAIEQFRKGDLLQRVIDDVASDAANAAEMKAAASGNPLILMQVQLAADLRKLEALYSQHQRSQHRIARPPQVSCFHRNTACKRGNSVCGKRPPQGFPYPHGHGKGERKNPGGTDG